MATVSSATTPADRKRPGAQPARGGARGAHALVVCAIALGGCSGDPPRPSRPPPGPPLHAVEINVPARLTSVETGETDALGRPVRVACATCHALRRPDALPKSMVELDEFHQGLELVHGGLSCATCHVLGDQTTLRLADGREIAMTDAMLLCRQCHGTQARDYDRGAHGGMSGHWDLSVGPRVRNHCIDCHDAHAPQFEASRPVLPPRDRGMVPR
jgi:formate-dependent nitrite reductase cytochrome c552 subunit